MNRCFLGFLFFFLAADISQNNAVDSKRSNDLGVWPALNTTLSLRNSQLQLKPSLKQTVASSTALT